MKRTIKFEGSLSEFVALVESLRENGYNANITNTEFNKIDENGTENRFVVEK